MNIGVSYQDINTNNSTVLRTGVSLITNELELLLNMPKHSLFFGNNMGLDLEKYLFLRNRRATYNLIRDDIQEVLLKYGKVRMKELVIVFNDDSKLNIILTVEVRATREIINMPITVGV